MSIILLQPPRRPALVPAPAPANVARYRPTLHANPGTVGGAFGTTPAGTILHGSRSGRRWGMPTEYDHCRSYAASGIELGWNLTVGEDAVSAHMPPDRWGWNARRASSRYLAVEFAQANLGDPITDGQVRAFCWWIVAVARKRWPGLPANFPTHAEVEQRGETGAIDGKSDVEPFGRHSVRDRVLARLASHGETWVAA